MLPNLQFNLQQIIQAAYDAKKWKSLFIFKPAKIIKFNIIDCSSSEIINRKKEILLHSLNTGGSLVEDIPYKFSYTFVDSVGTVCTLQLLDWEIYHLTGFSLVVLGAMDILVVTLIFLAYRKMRV